MPCGTLDILIALKALCLADGLSGTDRKVGCTLLEHYNRRTGRCDPSHERVAGLVDVHPRTVIRSIKRLVRRGLFIKLRHGGYSNRNSYQPVWRRFREIETNWKTRFRARSRRAEAAELSPLQGQSCHWAGDKEVTQTCLPNLSKKTLAEEILEDRPTDKEGSKKRREQARKEVKEPSSSYPHSLTPYFRSKPSSEAVRDAAEGRWNRALVKRFSGEPELYARLVELIDPAIQNAATDAEMQSRGGGLAFILNRLHHELIGPANTHQDRGLQDDGDEGDE
jgi:hypothetical protein